MFTDSVWERIEAALAAQALFSARLLAGEMPAQIEEVFTGAGAPLFPATAGELAMECSCPDWGVPCKHIAATFYLLAEAFDANPFEILHWRGRDKQTLLAHLHALRHGGDGGPRRRTAKRRTAKPAPEPAAPTAVAGAAIALADMTSPELVDTIDRFWVPGVPLPARPPTLDTEADLVLRQLSAPPADIGGAELLAELRIRYAAFRPPAGPADA